MERKEYEAIKQKIEAEYKSIVEKAEMDRRVRLEGLEYIWGVSPKAVRAVKLPPPPSKQKKAKPAKPAKRNNPPLTQAQIVLQLAAQIDGGVTQPKIRQLLQQEYPDLVLKMDSPRIATIMKDLYDRGKLERVTKGGGSTPSVYRLPNRKT